MTTNNNNTSKSLKSSSSSTTSTSTLQPTHQSKTWKEALMGLYYYYKILILFIFMNKNFKDLHNSNSNSNTTTITTTTTLSLHTKVHLYSLSLVFYLWNEPHYRCKDFQRDLLTNFRNVAIPGTGIPLSFFCYTKLGLYFMVFICYPWISAMGACVTGWKNCEMKWEILKEMNMEKLCAFRNEMASLFYEYLLEPQDWFTLWRINSRLSAYHYLMTGSPGWEMENKWHFLREGEKVGVPVSPFFNGAKDKRFENLVIKDKNEEGGMGIWFFKNATNGGQFIIQEILENDAFVSSCLPENPPLSTFRVMTASKAGLHVSECNPRGILTTTEGEKIENGKKKEERIITKEDYNEMKREQARKGESPMIEAISCVFRAGRENAKTDHSSILFDVDKSTGEILNGTSNMNWYQLGLRKGMMQCEWNSTISMRDHPDGGKGENSRSRIPVSGKIIPNIQEMLELVCESHYRLLPDIPMVGWDVCLCTTGTFFLEVNLSCNFFRGSFNQMNYFTFMSEYFFNLDEKRQNELKEKSKKNE